LIGAFGVPHEDDRLLRGDRRRGRQPERHGGKAAYCGSSHITHEHHAES
jgi:hypothetical protein